MWVMLNDAMFSIIEYDQDPTTLVVRARREGDIEKVFRAYRDKVEVTPARDYRYRIYADRTYVSEIMSSEVHRIDYGNFKDSVEDHDLHDAYVKVWCAMHDLQMKLAPDHVSWLDAYYEQLDAKRHDKQEYYDKLFSAE